MVTKKQRIYACLTAFAVLFVMLTSLALIIVEADHDCHGEDCHICQQIAVCVNTLKQISTATVALSAVVALIYSFGIVKAEQTDKRDNATLITLKVKFSD